jgi:hypothetical protein
MTVNPWRGAGFPIGLDKLFAKWRRACYRSQMRTTSETRLAPSALPLGDAEQAAWDALSSEQRAALLDEMFARPECNTYTLESMDEILAAAKARITVRRG